MKFLSRIAQIALKVGTVVGIFGPMIQSVAPVTSGVVQKIQSTSSRLTSIILQVELSAQALGLKGPDKLKMAAPNIAQVILESTALAGRNIANPTLFIQGATKVADGWADVLNSLHEYEAERLTTPNT